MPDNLANIAASIYQGDAESVAGLVRQCLEAGMAPGEVLTGGLIAGMDQVGKDFRAGDLFVPEVLVSARAMQAGMDILRPLLAETGVRSSGVAVIGTVEGDLHDIGKNLVKMMLEGAGFAIIDLGTDVKPQAFVDAARQHKPNIVGMSALLTTTMVKMGATIDAFKEAGLRDSVRILVGGAPVTAAYADQIGADGYAPDAAAAVDVAKKLLAA